MGLAMAALVCELCGSDSFTKEGDFFVCDSCRTKYTADHAKTMMIEGTVKVDRSHETNNFLRMAQTAAENTNWSEAYDYANRALEIDPENFAAWLVKGKAAGWTSTIKNFRVNEMLGAFRSVLNYAPADKQDELKRECANVMNNVAVAVQKITLNHAEQFVQVDATWQGYITQCANIVAVLQVAYDWNRARLPLDNVITIASTQIKGLTYTNFAGTPSIRFLQPAYEQKMRDLMARTADEIRSNFDSAYVTPNPERPKLKEGCFIVTATMGDERAFPVVTLRKFRDQLLMRTSVGRGFITWYYRHGPALAARIEGSSVKRALVFAVLVAPATGIAWVTLRLWRGPRDATASRARP
jgi:hypothetical protein